MTDKICTRCGKEGHMASQCKVRCMDCSHSTLKRSGLAHCKAQSIKWKMFSPVFERLCGHFNQAPQSRVDRFSAELEKLRSAI